MAGSISIGTMGTTGLIIIVTNDPGLGECGVVERVGKRRRNVEWQSADRKPIRAFSLRKFPPQSQKQVAIGG